MGQTGIKKLIILTAALIFCVCGTVSAKDGKQAVKLPEFKDKAKTVKYSQDEQAFYVWLNKFWPEEVLILKSLEKDPEEFSGKLGAQRRRFVRLWKGYKENRRLGTALVAEVKLRYKRSDLVDKTKAAKTPQEKNTLSAELNKLVSQEFDAQVKIKRIRYELIRKKIRKMAKELSKREAEVKKMVDNKDAEVKQRVNDLLTE